MTATATPKIDGSTAASMELEDRGPFGPPLGEPLDGPMATAGRRVWQSADGTITVGLWECAPGRFWTVFEGEGEFIRIVGGRLTCVEEGGATVQLGAGDAMTFPPGWSGEWRIEETLRKVFVGWTAGGPESGRGTDASTTTSLKIDGAAVASMDLEEQEPFPPERTAGSPLGRRGRTVWRSTDGSVETGVWECDAGRFHADFGAFGELMHVVRGEVECTGDDGSSFALRPGDAMTFPRGWTGEWDVRSPLRKVYACWEAR